jgi:bacterioferritin
MFNGAAAYRNIGKGLEQHAQEELQHALVRVDRIHSLGGIQEIRPKLVKTSDNREHMLQFALENRNETIRNYREGVGHQCEALGEHAMAEQIF